MYVVNEKKRRRNVSTVSTYCAVSQIKESLLCCCCLSFPLYFMATFQAIIKIDFGHPLCYQQGLTVALVTLLEVTEVARLKWKQPQNMMDGLWKVIKNAWPSPEFFHKKKGYLAVIGGFL